MYHNAGDTGLQANKRSLDFGGEKQNLSNLAQGFAIGDPAAPMLPIFLDGPFSRVGHVGAQNIADWLAYDDGIDRVRDIQVINGSLLQPTAIELIQHFDIVIAYTDNKCGQPIPAAIANQAANALAGFISAPGKGLLLTGFAFSRSIGFGDAIFGAGLSPLRKGGPGLDPRCSRDSGACGIGRCPATNPATGNTCSNQSPPGTPPTCIDDGTGQICTAYQPLRNNADLACDSLLPTIDGPTSSSWATLLTPANVPQGATLCFNYDINNADGSPGGSGSPFLAINAARNIVAINGLPADSQDIQKFWYACLIGNVVHFLSGDKHRCDTPLCR